MNSYFQDIEYQIAKRIRLAQTRILIAVAWFTKESLGDEIIRKKNLDIEILVDENSINRNSPNILNLLENKLEVTFIKNLNKNYYLMHNKFCIIDNRTVITGSYNWTKNANSNDENITIFEDLKNAAYYTHEFRRIKNLKYKNDNVFFTTDESTQVIELIYSAFLDLLKSNIKNLEKGLFTSWTNEKVKNLLRRINENIRNNLHEKVERFKISMELVSKYGIENFSRANKEERIELGDKMKKEGLDEVEYFIDLQLQFYKLKAIKKLQDNYLTLLRNNINDSVMSEKIFKVFEFINLERLEIVNERNMKN